MAKVVSLNVDDAFQFVRSQLWGACIQDIAEQAGVSPATLYYWQDGTTKAPQLRTISAVLDVLGYALVVVKKADAVRQKKPA